MLQTFHSVVAVCPSKFIIPCYCLPLKSWFGYVSLWAKLKLNLRKKLCQMFLDRQSTPSSFLTGRAPFTPNLPTLPTFAIFRHAFCILFLCFEGFSFIFVFGFFNTTHMCMIFKKNVYTQGGLQYMRCSCL